MSALARDSRRNRDHLLCLWDKTMMHEIRGCKFFQETRNSSIGCHLIHPLALIKSLFIDIELKIVLLNTRQQPSSGLRLWNARGQKSFFELSLPRSNVTHQRTKSTPRTWAWLLVWDCADSISRGSRLLQELGTTIARESWWTRMFQLEVKISKSEATTMVN